jgi:hypothetical protein
MRQISGLIAKWTAILVLGLMSAHAFATDLDGAIGQQDAEASQILSTLGHPVNQKTSKDTDQKLKVALIRHKAHRAQEAR